MDETQRFGLLKGNARKILAELMNLPAVNDLNGLERAEDFVRKYGVLHVYLDTCGVLVTAEFFRKVWGAESPTEVEEAERYIESIFSAGYDKGGSISGSRPLFRLTLSDGRWAPVERTLLDILALELARSRKMIARCMRPGCEQFFARLYPNDRYCGTKCADKMRSLGQRKWALEHQEETRKRRRKNRKVRRTA